MEPSETTVLVTGASGFIALHCVLDLLQEGYRVRGTVRAASREERLRQTLARHVDAGDRLDFVIADLADDAGWDEAVAGCRYVLHVASPFPPEVPKHEDELIVPARDGALRVLGAASRAGVERVVMTSSVAAIMFGHERDGSRAYNEDDWTVVDKAPPYHKSKTIAERAAWDFVASLDNQADGEEASGDQAKGEEADGKRPMELVVINPGLVLGPLLDANFSTSGEVVRKLMKREFPGCPPIGWAPVDVRDVAAAHIAAMTEPKAAGKRLCCAIEHAWMRDIALILDKHFSARGYKIPTRALPGFVLRIVAIFDKTARLAVDSLGKREDVDNSRIKEVLGWQPRSLEDMVVDMAESMIEYGVV